ncbi:long-chain acyl-CoA synthetase [Desulfatibacillum alkenivorans DSM 16219]|jgi:long-chain acyl-CoA synthetase|uniref:Long-chain acyl-CoA synthetase n=1 Tax=Desulfatibacillum alkenivorans DSM 16219 TaxID=1121393 RepID=A0A1M6XPB5_9BACT|nr:long-chain fatty acid--CoA ligase [Desulfatibacillum alkenivorans]SHL07728.1 long-chain acyl-CoA synthetase [Desulfatibacillum alkenivorans DSM 16219]
MNLASVLECTVKEYPDKAAVVLGDMRLSYQAVNAMANQIANGLVEAGIQKGDKVALSCPNLPYFPIVYYGVLKAGAVVVPLSVLLKGREIAYHLTDSDAKAYFCFQGSPELPMAEEGYKGFQDSPDCKEMFIITADPAAASPIEGLKTLGQFMAGQSPVFETAMMNADDTAVILYTSGTTGHPKGAELTHCNLLMQTLTLVSGLQLKAPDVHLVLLPLFHSAGQAEHMNAGFSTGNTLVLVPRFSAEAALEAMQKEKVSVFIGVPTMYWELLNYEDKDNRFDLEKISNALRIGVAGAASLPVEIIRGFEEKYNIAILEGYGLTETSPTVSFNHIGKERKVGSVGTPVWGVQAKIFDDKHQEVPVGEVGEIVVQGHNVMKGYYKKPDETARAFNGTNWLHTGDLGRMDEDGYIYIVDRVKDMIIRGGFNVYPREIEEVLMTHPAVSLVAVVGEPHERHGEEIKAYIVLKKGQTATPEEITAWSKEQMASYKYPRIVEITEALPMNATGKILKKNLKKQAG